MNKYCISRFGSIRIKTPEVSIGNVKIGAENPIAVQSMTNAKTQDVEASLRQCIALAEAGCQIIRLTAQNIDAAKALGEISKKFKAAGFQTPLVADIHFLPQAAMEAVEHVEKIRINPGNFADKKNPNAKDLSESQYNAELDNVRQKLLPLIKRCKELGRAMRIGSNHGSLSDRIVGRYGDTPLGMVESAFEFARICKELDFNNLVFSFKTSNTRIMTQTYRLAVKMMAEQDLLYPLHLGVTEAGFGEDARIKSAMGIAGLLLDGIGDTIRVSLTEDPVEEIPVAKDLASLIEKIRAKTSPNFAELSKLDEKLDFFSYSKRESFEISQIKVGASNVPQTACFGECPNADIQFREGNIAKLENAEIIFGKYESPEALNADMKNSIVAAEIPNALLKDFEDAIKSAEESKNLILVAPSPVEGRHAVGEARLLAAQLKNMEAKTPVWLKFDSSKTADENAGELSKLHEASIYLGSLMCDGIGDIASVEFAKTPERNLEICLNILQGARARRSKAEYIACPSCGRTLYDIQEAAAKIQAATSHLKDITIGIMGCIVNGPGEMADADFGYVGGAPGKINLYKAKECVEINIPQEVAIDRLIALIKSEGKWSEPKQ